MSDQDAELGFSGDDPDLDDQEDFELLPQLVAHLRRNRAKLRQEWATRIAEANLLQAMTPQEMAAETTSVYDNYVEVLETGSVEALQHYARDLQVLCQLSRHCHEAPPRNADTRGPNSARLSATLRHDERCHYHRPGLVQPYPIRLVNWFMSK